MFFSLIVMGLFIGIWILFVVLKVGLFVLFG